MWPFQQKASVREFRSTVEEQKMKLQCEKEKHAHSPEFCPSLI
jgi:hypothetical protein